MTATAKIRTTAGRTSSGRFAPMPCLCAVHVACMSYAYHVPCACRRVHCPPCERAEPSPRSSMPTCAVWPTCAIWPPVQYAHLCNMATVPNDHSGRPACLHVCCAIRGGACCMDAASMAHACRMAWCMSVVVRCRTNESWQGLKWCHTLKRCKHKRESDTAHPADSDGSVK